MRRKRVSVAIGLTSILAFFCFFKSRRTGTSELELEATVKGFFDKDGTRYVRLFLPSTNAFPASRLPLASEYAPASVIYTARNGELGTNSMAHSFGGWNSFGGDLEAVRLPPEARQCRVEIYRNYHRQFRYAGLEIKLPGTIIIAYRTKTFACQ
jgi:hypothetical protein